jgi:DNA-directed RNA polymerase specialized sigma24 family protein
MSLSLRPADRTWAEELRSGESAAWERLRRFLRSVLRRASAQLRGARLDDAEADALVEVFSSLPRLCDDARLLAFVAQVVRRLGHRGERHRRRESGRCLPLESSPEPAVVDHRPEELLADETLGECLAALRSVPERRLLRCLSAGRDDREVARELGISSHALAQRKLRLRQRLGHFLPARSTGSTSSQPTA